MDVDELVRQLQASLDEGVVSQLYQIASIRPQEVLEDLRSAGIKVYAVKDVEQVSTEQLDEIADQYIRSAKRRGAMYGATFGMGGMLSVAPELAYLFVSLIRIAQRLSTTYGLDYESAKGRLELWTAIGRGVGIKLDLDGLESSVYRDLPVIFGKGPFRDPLLFKVIQKVLVSIGIKMSTRISRLVPLVGAGVGVVSTYLYLERIGRKLKEEFRTRHQLQHLNLTDAAISEEISYTLEDEQG